MKAFFEGFEKKAAEDQPGAIRRWALPAAATVGAGLGAYALLRRGGIKGPLTRTAVRRGRVEPFGFGKFKDKILYGADDVHYIPEGAVSGSKPRRVSGTVVAESPEDASFIRGDRTVGLAKNKQIQQSLDSDKLYEAKLMKKYSPGVATPTKGFVAKDKGVRKLRKLHEKTKGDYWIKPRFDAYASGVGGSGLIRSSDVVNFLNKQPLSPHKKKLLQDFLRKPQDFVHQQDMGILRDVVTGTPRETRVHSIGGKVVRGATSIRGKNVTDLLRQRAAERHVQEFLDKLPVKYKDPNLAMAPDVAMTQRGPRIVELNAGGVASGFMDPHFLKKHSPLLQAVAAKNNWALYRHLVGRSHRAPAALKASGAAGAAGVGATLATRPKPDESSSEQT